VRILALVLAAVVVMLIGLSVGAVPIPLADLFHALREPRSEAGTILWQLRLPRVVLAFLVGGALGVSGTALQALVRNPLAEPYLLGISGGAGLAAVTAIALGLSGVWALPGAAFLGAVTSAAVVYRIANVPGARLEPRVLVLVGVVVAAFTGAIMSALLTLSEAAQLRNAFLWLLGGFGTANWQSVAAFGAYAILPFGLVFRGGRSLDLLSLGDEPAHALGSDVDATKRLVYFTTALLTAASVAVSGMIGFVGLVAPHAMRAWVGPLHRRLLPAAFLASGTLVVGADAIARTVLRPAELPVGAVTALIGVPVFAWLVRRSLA
jgi:iron complex transport system permease protein